MKHLHYALLPIVALAFASCSEDLEEFESPKAELEGKFYKQYEITADCSFNDPETRAVLENDAKVNWEDIDKLIIWTGEARDGGNYTVSEANMGEFTRTTKNGVNTFYGYLQDTEAESEPADDTPLYAYVASEYIEPVYVTENYGQYSENGRIYETTGFLCVDLSEQNGTMEDAMKHDLLWSTLPYSDFKNNRIPNVQFEHEMSILKYTLTLEGAGTTKADIRLSGYGLAKKVNFWINTGKSFDAIKWVSTGYHVGSMILGDITLKDVEIKDDVATIYVALFPSMFTEMQAFVTLADGRRATASVGGNFDDYPIQYTLEAGKIYIASATVEPVEVTAKVGDYYNSDGSYTTEPQSNSIGVVFSTKTSARDFAAGYTNGYVMALQNVNDNKGVMWDTQRESIYDKNGLRTTPCLMGGSWYFDRDGRYETDMILKFRASNGEDRCPAAYAAYTFEPIENYAKPTGASDWFLPSVGQAFEIMTNLCGLIPDENCNGMYWNVPVNLARNTSVLDRLITCDGEMNGWLQNDQSVDWEDTYAGIALNNINSKLEKASLKGVTVHLFDNPNLLTNSARWYWTSGDVGGGTAQHYSFDDNGGVSIAGHTQTNNPYAAAANVTIARPVLAF